MFLGRAHSFDAASPNQKSMNFGKSKARSFERWRQCYGSFVWGRLCCLALLTSLTTGAFGAVVADYSALRKDRDPTSQGWVGELVYGPGRDVEVNHSSR